MKKCFKCGVAKNISDFYKHPSTKDGYLGKCKDCTKTDVTTNYAKRVDQYHEYDKQRQRKNLKRIYSSRYNQIRARVGGFASRHYSSEGKPMLTPEEYQKWLEDNQKTFDTLYAAWEQSGFIKALSPSIDRINNEVGYIASNMQWLSFSDNASKGTN